MKHLIALSVCSFLLALASCAPNPHKIAEKIQNGETLSEKEYKEALDYTIGIADRFMDSIAAHPNDFHAIVESVKSINEENPDLNTISGALISADPSTLSESNRKLHETFLKKLDGMAEAIRANGPVMRLDDRDANGSLNAETDAVKPDTAVRTVDKPATRKLTDEDKSK